MHGLRGHPQGTWESPEAETATKADAGPSSARKGIRSLFKSKPTSSAASSTSSSPPTTASPAGARKAASRETFWPRDYLVQDIEQARVWTYGYNADVIGGLFQANNKNSVSQHGRNLAVQLEREIENHVVKQLHRPVDCTDEEYRTRSSLWLTAWVESL